MPPSIEVQGHRGGRGLKPENTLPAFEVAMDLGVASIETDLHLSADGWPVLHHDPFLNPGLVRRLPGSTGPDPAERPRIRSLSLVQLRGYRADGQPFPVRFPGQDVAVTPLAALFAARHGIHPYTPPTLADLCAFVHAYAGDLGHEAGKSDAPRRAAAHVRLDLELKRVAYHSEYIGDDFDGERPGLLEQRVAQIVSAAGLAERTTVRSFDHRAVRAMRALNPAITGGVLIGDAVPAAPEQVARAAGASVYCPRFSFVDEITIRRLHDHGMRVLPWTVNEPADWDRLLGSGVDGLTTDYPDRLLQHLSGRQE